MIYRIHIYFPNISRGIKLEISKPSRYIFAPNSRPSLSGSNILVLVIFRPQNIEVLQISTYFFRLL